MISEFLTLVRRLHVHNYILDHYFLQDKDWPLDKNEKLCQYCSELLEYGKNNYWDGDKMTN